MRVGDPEAEGTEMGPLISAEHREKVASFVDGNRVGSVATRPTAPASGSRCTLVEASNDDSVAREEVFGPVAAVIPFEDEADAIRIANDDAVRALGLDLDARTAPGRSASRARHRLAA